MRVFLDASVFIWALERPESNSARIVGAALTGSLDCVVDEEVVNEVSRFVRKHIGRTFAWLYAQQIERNCRVVARSECSDELAALKGKLKPADRLHLAATRVAGAKVLVAFDEDFEGFPEYLTPKQAAKRLGLGAHSSEW